MSDRLRPNPDGVQNPERRKFLERIKKIALGTGVAGIVAELAYIEFVDEGDLDKKAIDSQYPDPTENQLRAARRTVVDVNTGKQRPGPEYHEAMRLVERDIVHDELIKREETFPKNISLGKDQKIESGIAILTGLSFIIIAYAHFRQRINELRANPR